jgi:M6 family metalloprotease-like protein
MKKNGLKKLVVSASFLFTLLGATALCHAAPMNGNEMDFKQPDGSMVKVKVFGDEFYQRVESLDGYTLVRDPKTNWICYAKLNNDQSDLLSTGEVYKASYADQIGKNTIITTLEKGLDIKKDALLQKVNAEKNKAKFDDFINYPMQQVQKSTSPDTTAPNASSNTIQANAPGNGNVIGLTILINFPDEKGTFTKSQVHDLVNKSGYTGFGNNGSVRDYFSSVSGGKLTYTNNITEYYTAKNSKSYYDNPSLNCGDQGRKLLKEALDSIKNNSSYFANLTTGSDKKVLAVNVYYVGQCHSGWSKGLWPNSFFLSTPYKINDNIYIERYQITNQGSELTIGTFCHENGHMVCGYPDTYDYGGDSKGTGRFDLMGMGNDAKNPVPPNPYFRNGISKWSTYTDIRNYKTNDITLTPNTIGTFAAFKTYSPNEFFLFENIKNTAGTRYAKMPGNGLLVWHIDTKGNNDNQQMTPTSHYMVSVEQADGLFDLEKNKNYGQQNDFFNQGYKTSFNQSTTPNSRWWDNSDSNLNISNIRNSGSNIVFNNSYSFNKAPKYNSQQAMPNNICMGDVNRDGVKDFVQFNGKKLVAYGSDFVQTPLITAYAGLNIKRVITGDFVNAGFDQILTITTDNMLNSYGTSPDNTELWWAFSQASFITDTDDVLLGDFNGDQKDDLMIYNKSTGKISFYSIKPSGYIFEPMPLIELGNIPVNYFINSNVRVGDYDGNGRDDVLFITSSGQVLYYASVYSNGKNTFWWAFTTASNTINSNEDVIVAKVDDNQTFDLIVHNDTTGAIKFYRPEYDNGGLKPLSFDKGQISITPNSKLFASTMKGYVTEPGNTTRNDMIVYDKTSGVFIRSDARWDGTKLTYWWAYTQYPKTNP